MQPSFREKLLQIARNVAEASGGRVRLAHNEEDASTDHQPEAAHFLKLDGQRLGRDIEVYGLMAEVGGAGSALADFAEIVLCLKGVESSYRVAVDAMLALGAEAFGPGLLPQWNAIFINE